MKVTFSVFLREQFAILSKPASYAPSLAGKTVVITGANVGLGFEAAQHPARLHPGRLILACRDPKKGKDAADAIRRVTGCENVEACTLDIASNASLKAFAEKFAKEIGKLDILVENAGVNVPKMERTDDGWEKNIGINHLGTAHLALRMLPFLLQASQPRVVILASDVHYLTTDPEGLNQVDVLHRLNSDKQTNKFESFNGIQRYNVSKTLNVLWGEELSKHIPSSSSLAVSTVNPGFCVSSLLRDQPFFLRVFNHLVGRSTEVGSRTIVHAAVAPALQGKTGVYLSSCRITEPSDFVISKEGQEAEKKIWAETLDILGQVDPEVTHVADQYLSK
ncbi:NADP-binding protein [Dacryopinax primogenitus]|uniref:NADP-binding protein n=1 Tax=Dacryopinax primogenitus (strain DJM 731) TaxID=1858805 RepID=M5FR49_DACPD|nr:NADP-binding protein [Dacryopinax primogenitus]EJT99540.1 NADP-binding protein [Dacryopinax primogenitus]